MTVCQAGLKCLQQPDRARLGALQRCWSVDGQSGVFRLAQRHTPLCLGGCSRGITGSGSLMHWTDSAEGLCRAGLPECGRMPLVLEGASA